MKKHFSVAVVTAKPFNKEGMNTDKNGVQNVYLQAVAGKVPSKSVVMAGTLAQNEGFEVGKTYLVDVFEIDPSEEYGRQFSISKLSELGFSDIMSAKRELGSPVVVEIIEEKDKVPSEPKDIE